MLPWLSCAGGGLGEGWARAGGGREAQCRTAKTGAVLKLAGRTAP